MREKMRNQISWTRGGGLKVLRAWRYELAYCELPEGHRDEMIDTVVSIRPGVTQRGSAASAVRSLRGR